jgi:hypothetical protein
MFSYAQVDNTSGTQRVFPSGSRINRSQDGGEGLRKTVFSSEENWCEMIDAQFQATSLP